MSCGVFSFSISNLRFVKKLIFKILLFVLSHSLHNNEGHRGIFSLFTCGTYIISRSWWNVQLSWINLHNLRRCFELKNGYSRRFLRHIISTSRQTPFNDWKIDRELSFYRKDLGNVKSTRRMYFWYRHNWSTRGVQKWFILSFVCIKIPFVRCIVILLVGWTMEVEGLYFVLHMEIQRAQFTIHTRTKNLNLRLGVVFVLLWFVRVDAYSSSTVRHVL